MPTINLSNWDCKKLAVFGKEYEEKDVDVNPFRLGNYILLNKKSDVLYCKLKDDHYNFWYVGALLVFNYLQETLREDWCFVQEVNYIEFYENSQGEVEGTIRYSANWVHEDDIEIAVSKLSRGDQGWAVLVFYGDELTLIKDKLEKTEANSWKMTLTPETLSNYTIKELIESHGFREFTVD